MDKQIYSLSGLKRVTCYVIAIALVCLFGSLYWEPLHKVCLVAAFICGTLVASFHSRTTRGKPGWLNMIAIMATLLPMSIVTHHLDHSDGLAIKFQYMGFFFLAWPLSLLFFESRVQIERDPAATGKPPDPNV